MVEKRKPINHVSATVWMLLGSMVVLSSVVVLNEFSEAPAGDGDRPPTQLNVAPKPKPKPQKVVQKPKPQKPQRTRTLAPPPAGLGSAIAGVDLGIPEFSLDQMGDLNDSILGDMSDVVMTDEAVDVPPKPTQQAPMNYPASARAKGVTGYVVLNLLIDESGHIAKVKLLESSPSGVFDDVAVTGVRNWRFEPAKYQGEKVKVWAKQKIQFDLG